MTRWLPHTRNSSGTAPTVTTDAWDFHRSLPDYATTPLVDLPVLASEWNVGRVVAKDESTRLGLPAFKALGASWAIHRAIADADGPMTVVTATDGNHGRAVARFSRLAGHSALIFIPDGVHPSAVRAIRDEGAAVREVGGSYDEAVAAAARASNAASHVLVQDTAWDGYEEIPGWIVDGYATLFAETDQQLTAIGIDHVDLALIPTGVGSLLQAALTYYRGTRQGLTRVVSVEPTEAACVAPSLEAGEPVTVETGTTIMSGLNCGTLSMLAWPLIRDGLDGAVAVPDDEVLMAARELTSMNVAPGPCGGSGSAAARALLTGDGAMERRQHLDIDLDSTVLLVITEGSDANPLAE